MRAQPGALLEQPTEVVRAHLRHRPPVPRVAGRDPDVLGYTPAHAADGPSAPRHDRCAAAGDRPCSAAADGRLTRSPAIRHTADPLGSRFAAPPEVPTPDAGAGDHGCRADSSTRGGPGGSPRTRPAAQTPVSGQARGSRKAVASESTSARRAGVIIHMAWRDELAPWMSAGDLPFHDARWTETDGDVMGAWGNF